MIEQRNILRDLIEQHRDTYGSDFSVGGILDFYELLLGGNKVQNLTRLTSPQAFFFGHLVDVLELRRSNLLGFPAMDLGSGCGVPGLLWAAAFPGDGIEWSWVLAESEKRKAAFLQETAMNLGLKRVRVFVGRGEEALKTCTVDSVCVRAVGPVSRIYGWLKPCSTWNSLVLLKGPSWNEEWSSFAGQGECELKVSGTHMYQTHEPESEIKSRIIVRLNRN